MNCKRFQKILHEYLDESLPPRVRVRLEDHLRSCEGCRQALDRERYFSTSISQLVSHSTASLKLRPDIQRNVLEAMESGTSPLKTAPFRRNVLFRLALAAGGAACLLIGAVVVLHLHKRQPVQTVEPRVDHPAFYIMCMATTYADETKTDWVERCLIVSTRNGGEGYLKITARKPRKNDQTSEENEEES